MVPVDQLVPFVGPFRDVPERERLEIAQILLDGWLRLPSPGPGDRLSQATSLRCIDRRERQYAVFLEMLQQTQARLYPVVPLGRAPAQKLANLVPQLATTELRRSRNRFLNVRRRVSRLPKNVVDLSFLIFGSTGSLQRVDNPQRLPGSEMRCNFRERRKSPN